ncbi:MAG: hypothetical protein LBH59_03940 [Planctomycetaceae bacterium]|nr:hypothetical protein [Planctomycetaceae bacterium]
MPQSCAIKIKKEYKIPKPVRAVGFALEQTLHVVTLTVFSYVDFAYCFFVYFVFRVWIN